MPSYSGGTDREVPSSRPSQAKEARHHLNKTSQAWWFTGVTPGMQEKQVRESRSEAGPG
jgi:hypothetical protein